MMPGPYREAPSLCTALNTAVYTYNLTAWVSFRNLSRIPIEPPTPFQKKKKECHNKGKHRQRQKKKKKNCRPPGPRKLKNQKNFWGGPPFQAPWANSPKGGPNKISGAAFYPGGGGKPGGCPI
uniref:Uncharacterized protein n=1 Tax=Ornithodoros coriaceus TaxID=92741 RepID=B2D2E6_ORNCO|nr:hypothetical protein [Ornithodoros coriaceus]